MDIQTKTRGIVSVTEKQILSFPAGLFGFENYTSYALIEAEQKPFYWLQSLDKSDLAFLLIDPFLFRSDYEIDADDEALKMVDIRSPADAVVLAIITIPASGKPITANLQGPGIINKRNNKAVQAILADPRWQTKHDILTEAGKRGSAC